MENRTNAQQAIEFSLKISYPKYIQFHVNNKILCRELGSFRARKKIIALRILVVLFTKKNALKKKEKCRISHKYPY